MPQRFASRGPGIVGAVALAALFAACAAPDAPGEATGTSGAPKGRTSSILPDVTTVPPTAKTYVATRELTLRTGPSHHYDTRATLPPGTVVTPNGYVSGSWWQVDTDKFGTGWIDSTGVNPAS
jgi:uncharacterized protein YgiM (DUF1202 family)